MTAAGSWLLRSSWWSRTGEVAELVQSSLSNLPLNLPDFKTAMELASFGGTSKHFERNLSSLWNGFIHVYSMNLSDMISHDRPGGYNAYVSGAGAGFSGHRDQMPMGHSVIPPAVWCSDWWPQNSQFDPEIPQNLSGNSSSKPQNSAGPPWWDVQDEAKVGNPDALAGAFAAEQAHGVSYDPNIATLIRETDD